MALTTLAAVQAAITYPYHFSKAVGTIGTAAIFGSSWYQGNYPAAGVLDNSTSGGVVRSSSSGLVTGQLPFYDPPVGQNTYLAKLSASVGPNQLSVGSIYLVDRLWDCGAQYNGGVNGLALDPTATGAQTINSAAWPNRDQLGGANGVGVIIGLEIASTLGAAPSAAATITYTNTANVGSRTGTLIAMQAGNNGFATCFYPFSYAAGDLGVKSVQALTLGTSVVSGSIALVAYRLIAVMELCPEITSVIDPLTGNFPQMFNGSVPFFLSHQTANTNPILAGAIYYAQG